jgi:16S rRNA (cytosine967-C5)-methyltransferase
MTTAVRPAPSARNVAFAVLRDVFGPAGRGAAESLDRHLRASALDARDRAFVTELAYGTIEGRRWLDWQLEPYLGARAAKLPLMIAEILRLGTYQLRAMRVHEYAAVSESVQLARRFGHPGTAGLVNAVLRRVSTDPERPVADGDFPAHDDVLGTRASLPTWLVRMWRERFGAELLPAILAGVNAPAATGASIDRRKGTRDELIAILGERGIVAEASAFAADAVIVKTPAPTPELRAALGERAELHAEAACFPADLLDPQPGERILEACSGRGNKTLQLASAIGDRGTIVAIDNDARKIARARARLDEAHLTSVELRTGDASALDGSETFDAVLLDAPCSGIGIIGRQPEARWRKSPDDGARLAPLQRALLDGATRALGPGGRLVYAVCSTDPREGEGVIEPFLAAHPDIERVALPERYAPLATPSGDVLVAPGIEGRDGFFIAVLRRAVLRRR